MPLQDRAQVSSRDVFEQKVQIVLILKSSLKFDDVRVATEFLANIAFAEDGVDLVVTDDVVLLDYF